MRKITLLTLLWLLTLPSFAQFGQEIYHEFSDRNAVKAMYVSPTMFGIMSKIPNIQHKREGLDLYEVFPTFSGMYFLQTANQDEMSAIRKKLEHCLKRDHYELWMEVKSPASNPSKNSARFFTLGDEQFIQSLVMIADEPVKQEFSFLCIEGSIQRDKFQALVDKNR